MNPGPSTGKPSPYAPGLHASSETGASGWEADSPPGEPKRREPDPRPNKPLVTRFVARGGTGLARGMGETPRGFRTCEQDSDRSDPESLLSTWFRHLRWYRGFRRAESGNDRDQV